MVSHEPCKEAHAELEHRRRLAEETADQYAGECVSLRAENAKLQERVKELEALAASALCVYCGQSIPKEESGTILLHIQHCEKRKDQYETMLRAAESRAEANLSDTLTAITRARAAEARCREAHGHVFAIYNHLYDDPQAALLKAGERSQVWHWAKALLLLAPNPSATEAKPVDPGATGVDWFGHNIHDPPATGAKPCTRKGGCLAVLPNVPVPCDCEMDANPRQETESAPATKRYGKTWACKVGGVLDENLPPGADAPLRRAVKIAYAVLTGREPDYCFTGWDGKLDECEVAAVSPDPGPKAPCLHPAPTAKASDEPGDEYCRYCGKHNPFGVPDGP